MEEAIQNIKKVIEINPKDADAYFGLASVLSKQGNIQKAIHNYKKVIEINPKDADAYYNIANAL
jgi:tetratricopeptide (TPR) repeat protein